MSQPREYKVIVIEPNSDPRQLLARTSGLSANRIAHAMACGAVWLRNGHGIRRLRRRSAKLTEGDELFLNYDEKVLSQTVEPASLIRDGGRWSVWDKPSGMRAQGSRWGDHTTLGRFAETQLSPPRQAFIVHRLDLAASGLMLLAHDKKAAASLSAQFAARTVEKRYQALVEGEFSPTAPEVGFAGDIDGKTARTTASRLAYAPEQNRSLLLVTISTGRKHQIRRHLADAGFPIVGDRQHGRASHNGHLDMRLRAVFLAFDDPDSGSRVQIAHEAPNWL